MTKLRFVIINFKSNCYMYIICLLTDPLSEQRSNSVYVPRDESFSEVKQLTFSTKAVYSGLHALVPSLQTAILDKNLGFPLFSDIDDLFNEGFDLPPSKNKGLLRDVLPRLVKFINDTEQDILRFETPATMESKCSTIQAYTNS